MRITRIVFWEPCTSPHKADFFAAVAKLAHDIEVICCANSDLSDDRKAQGWSIQSTESFRTIIAPTSIEIEELVCANVGGTLHIFSGIRWVPSIVAGLNAVRKHGVQFAIMSEPRDAEGWKGKVRFLQSWLTEGWIRKNTEFVLGLGRNGPPWFISVGYSVDRIFPFAYFVDPPKQVAELALHADAIEQPIQIGYVGRLVKMKGVFDLVSATAKLGSAAHLSIVGAGLDEPALKTACGNLQVKADFLGVLPINEIGEFMQRLDVLVLASTTKDDGWGVVVSEALMAGTVVVATSCVGASIMLDDPIFGRCVPAESPEAIARAVNELQVAGAFVPEMRVQRAALARQCLSAEGGARHLLEIIQWRFAGAQRPAPFYQIKIKAIQ